MSGSSKGAANNGRHIERVATLKWIPISLMRISPLAQRELNQARVDKIAASFDPEQIGILTVNKRGDYYYIIDGQHRKQVMEDIGWGDQMLQCSTYEGLTESEEAEMFLKLNDVLPVNAYDKFKVGVVAGRGIEAEINRIVAKCGLQISRTKTQNSISCVGTLKRVMARADGQVLERTLSLIRDTYGASGYSSAVVDGVALMVQRYGADLKDDIFIRKLGGAHGGVTNLMGKAEVIRRQTGNQHGHCVAAAAVDIYNSTRGGKKLSIWWRSDK